MCLVGCKLLSGHWELVVPVCVARLLERMLVGLSCSRTAIGREQSLRLPLGLVCCVWEENGARRNRRADVFTSSTLGQRSGRCRGLPQACTLSFSHNSACTDGMLQPGFKCKLQVYLRRGIRVCIRAWIMMVNLTWHMFGMCTRQVRLHRSS